MKVTTIWVCLLASMAQAQDDPRAALLGLWGTQAQCARALLVAGGTVRAEPFEIREGWLRHGMLWCRLDWFTPVPRPDGVFAGARALCGEDSARAYRVGFSARGDELSIVWDDALVNGPLRRCHDN